MRKELIQTLQASLNGLGHHCGAVDGQPGPLLAAGLESMRKIIGDSPAPKPKTANAWPRDTDEELRAFYGEPGDPANMTHLQLPAPLHLYVPGGQLVMRLYCHKKIEPFLGAALAEIAELPDDLIRRHQLDVTGGCFNKRKRVGGSRLSVHSWGAAYDMAIGLNGYGEEPDMPGVVVDIFARHGAQWGGYWPTPDGMHFEFVN